VLQTGLVRICRAFHTIPCRRSVGKHNRTDPVLSHTNVGFIAGNTAPLQSSMAWPIDNKAGKEAVDYLADPLLQRRVRERLQEEHGIAVRMGFGCFAEYFADRRARGWGLNRLARETGQTKDWIRGVMRRYQ
jgi:hypothetical protein